jgi:16S rRNA (guanine527-N7)-methyltransferase
VTESRFRDSLLKRAAAGGVEVPQDVAEQLAKYWALFTRWTRVINLTSLPLSPPSDTAIDRLFLEPLAAAPFFPREAEHWVDLGSGGGSPAIPMKIRLVSPALVLTEARERKAVFLRDVIRQLGLAASEVATGRFEEFAAGRRGWADVVTSRAIAADELLATTAKGLLKPTGQLLLFQSGSNLMKLNGLEPVATQTLPIGSSTLGIYVPRGT